MARVIYWVVAALGLAVAEFWILAPSLGTEYFWLLATMLGVPIAGIYLILAAIIDDEVFDE